MQMGLAPVQRGVLYCLYITASVTTRSTSWPAWLTTGGRWSGLPLSISTFPTGQEEKRYTRSLFTKYLCNSCLLQASARRVGLKRLLDWILSVMALSLVPWRLVIGRLGRIGHGELRGWSTLLTRKSLKKAVKQLKVRNMSPITQNKHNTVCYSRTSVPGSQTCPPSSLCA